MNRTFGPVRAAVFDCDGVLVDSERPWIELMGELLAERAMDRAAAAGFHGVSADMAAEHIAAHTGESPARVRHEIDERYRCVLTQIHTAIPAAAAFVTELTAQIPAAVASNGRRRDVVDLLVRIGLADRFAVISTVEDVPVGKPDPALYRRSCILLGVAPQQTVVFEDSPVGAQAARAAGCLVVGVNADARIPMAVDLRVRSFTELRLVGSTLVYTPASIPIEGAAS